MKIGKEVDLDEVVKAFLKAEFMTARHQDRYANGQKWLKENNLSFEDFIEDPSLSGKRLEVFKEGRGWPDRLLFTNFPADTKWYAAKIEPADLKEIRYINYSYWNELSKNTSKTQIAAENIRSGVEVFGVSNDSFWEVASKAKQGERFPPIILFKNDDNTLTIIEGHTRLTGIELAGTAPADDQEWIVGISKQDNQWSKENKL